MWYFKGFAASSKPSEVWGVGRWIACRYAEGHQLSSFLDRGADPIDPCIPGTVSDGFAADWLFVGLLFQESFGPGLFGICRALTKV
jgi:hypothetical protein